MFTVALLAAAAGLSSLYFRTAEQVSQSRRAAAYRHPALVPATIYTPEFYASLTKRHNRPFLGK